MNNKADQIYHQQHVFDIFPCMTDSDFGSHCIVVLKYFQIYFSFKLF